MDSQDRNQRRGLDEKDSCHFRTVEIAPVAEIKARFSSYLAQCERGPGIVTKNGRPVAVLLSVNDEDGLEQLVLALTPRFRRLLDAAEERIKTGGGIRHKDFWAKVKK